MSEIVEPYFFNRDLSWLHFNGRVLAEADRDLPVLERIKFLAIFSSNLDEFYRVRMPVLLALEKIEGKLQAEKEESNHDLADAVNLIVQQQNYYGVILFNKIIPELLKNNICFIYNQEFPEEIISSTKHYFLSKILAYLQPINLEKYPDFFPNNNQLFFLVTYIKSNKKYYYLLNIPSDILPRFMKIEVDDKTYVVFIDDIIRYNLKHVFIDAEITGCYSFKITRDAEIDLKDEYAGDISEQLEIQLKKRDFGLATRFLYQANIPEEILKQIKKHFSLKKASMVQGGNYHNLKDLFAFPVSNKALLNKNWPEINEFDNIEKPIYQSLNERDFLLNTPFQNYDLILRFFNEAAIDPQTKEIYITLYRVASDSKIVNALISAAKNGVKVFVLIELKARFDEENNIGWSKKMRQAGVEIAYSVVALKVHAKVALVKREIEGRMHYSGLLSTGNFNESTASFYTDHVLFTAHKDILREIELLFIFLAKRIKPSPSNFINFKHLLVAQFNLKNRFLQLIDREIEQAKINKPAAIIIKLNNLEEESLIKKLYEASNAGVKITIIARSICRIVPGVIGMSENITVLRIVDRYLEHGRIFAFHNAGNTEVFLGSADWMNRNIYRRIEVCFPIYDDKIKSEILAILNLSVQDTKQAVLIDKQLNNIPVKLNNNVALQSQYEIYNFLKTRKKNEQITYK
jgi:polyphosphate kinase